MLFLANFLFMAGQEAVSEEDRRHGEFSMIIDAPSKEVAVQLFHERLEHYRRDSDFFHGNCKIYLTQLMEFDGFPRGAAMMVSYKSVAGDPAMPFIGCTIPTLENNACRIVEWDQNRPAMDGISEQMFIEFRDTP